MTVNMIVSGGVRYRPEVAEKLGLEPDPAPKAPAPAPAVASTAPGGPVTLPEGFEDTVAAKVAELLADKLPGLPADEATATGEEQENGETAPDPAEKEASVPANKARTAKTKEA